MKIKSTKRTKKIIIIAIIIFIFALAAGAFYLYSNQKNNNDKGLSTVENNRVEDKDQKLTDGELPAEDKTIVSDESTPISGGNIEVPNVTRAEQTGDFIRVSALFSKPSSGRCILKIQRPGANTISREAQIIVGPSYYVCNGFRIPVADLPSKGAWDIIVVHEAEGKTANSEKKRINVN